MKIISAAQMAMPKELYGEDFLSKFVQIVRLEYGNYPTHLSTGLNKKRAEKRARAA